MASIKRRGFLSAASGLTDSDLLEYATEELRSYIPSFLKGLREELLIVSADVSAVSPISMPARAVGAALRTIGWLQSDGNVRFLPRIEPENAGRFATVSGEPRGYMFQGNTLILLPVPTSGTIRLAYMQRPGQLVAVTACAPITGTSSTNVLTFAADTIPATMTSGGVVVTGLELDIVSGSPNFVARGIDVGVSAGSAAVTSITLGQAFPVGTVAGDYACIAGETCIPQVPTELRDLLAQATASAIATATGSARAPAIASKLDSMEKELAKLLSPRSDGSARAIVSRSAIGRWPVGW